MKKYAILTICAAFVCLSTPVVADPPPWPEFTFKREKAPKPGETRRITVHVDPVAPGAETDKKQDAPETGTSSARYDWFWERVSPSLEEDPPVRLRHAFSSLAHAPVGGAVAGPRLQTLQKIASAEGSNILKATIGTNVSPALVLAVIAVESSGKVDALSHKGAQGLMQLTPGTAERFGVTNSLAPDQNIKGGVAYLSWLLNEFDGDAVMALAGYNAGENAVKRHNGVPPYPETRDYVPKVLAAFEVASGLCKTRPELISDGCALSLASN